MTILKGFSTATFKLTFFLKTKKHFNKNRYFICQMVTSESQSARPIHPLVSIWPKLWEDSICEWPLKQTGLAFAWYQNFLTHWMVYSVYYLGWMVVNISVLFAEWSITEHEVTTFRYCCIGFFLAWSSLFIFGYRCDGHFSGFGKYIFPQRQTCTALVQSADCTECSCSLNIVIFNNFLVFNFPFFNFEQ